MNYVLVRIIRFTYLVISNVFFKRQITTRLKINFQPLNTEKKHPPPPIRTLEKNMFPKNEIYKNIRI